MAAYRNSRIGKKEEIPEHECHNHTPLDEYDLNFVFPVRVLESQGVRLEPLIVGE